MYVIVCLQNSVGGDAIPQSNTWLDSCTASGMVHFPIRNRRLLTYRKKTNNEKG